MSQVQGLQKPLCPNAGLTHFATVTFYEPLEDLHLQSKKKETKSGLFLRYKHISYLFSAAEKCLLPAICQHSSFDFVNCFFLSLGKLRTISQVLKQYYTLKDVYMPTKLLPIKTAFIISATVIIFSPILYTLIYSLASLYK